MTQKRKNSTDLVIFRDGESLVELLACSLCCGYLNNCSHVPLMH